MKGKILITAALALLAGVANAQVTSMTLGYCHGQVNTSSTEGFALTGTEGDVSAAVRIPAELVDIYEGCTIGSIRAGMASTLNTENLTVWVRTSLEGENLASATITKDTDPKMAKGWNLIALDEPFEIPAECGDLYVGLTFHQKNTSVALSIIDVPAADALYVQFGADAQWTDRSTDGALAIEAIVSGDKLPQYNLTLDELYVQPTFALVKKVLNGTIVVTNNGATTITGFDIVCSVEGDTKEYRIPVELEIAYGETFEVPFSFEPEGVGADAGTLSLTATINNLREGQDVYMADNTQSEEFNVVSRYWERNVLVEEFTTELCSNCPRVAGQMHAALETEGIDERVNVLCHHAGYYEDWLTIPADKSYLWLYGSSYAFAPALLFDRVESPATSNQAEGSPIFAPSADNGTEDILKAIRARMDEPAFVCLDMDVVLTDGNAHVVVKGERSVDFAQSQARIVVAVVEDDIAAHGQMGAEGVVTDYVQQHVNRVYNSTWGENLKFDGDSYEYTCDLMVDPTWKKEDLSVVAYIWDYDAADASNCEVSNSNRVRYAQMKDETSGIAEMEASAGAEEYYSLDGTRLSEPKNGFNIVRYGNGVTRKVMIRK